jgi:hypothetical protein
MITPMAHQAKFANLWGQKRRVLNFDECGTGKTLGCIHSVYQNCPGSRVLVLGTLTTLQSAWVNDLHKYNPHISVALATDTPARKKKAFTSNAQWVITNHDTIKMVADKDYIKQFDVLIVDEADVFRNKSLRTDALLSVAQTPTFYCGMTGTPTPKSVTDAFRLVLACDGGERLGRDFRSFQGEMCYATPIYGAPPGAMRYIDKPLAQQKLMTYIHDICSRVTLEEVVELPEMVKRTITIPLPRRLLEQYRELAQQSVLELEQGVVNAVNAAARRTKLLQLMSGAVYDENNVYHDIHTERHKLVADLAMQTDHALVAFNWLHQRDGICKVLRNRGVTFAYIDGTVSSQRRTEIVADYQEGKIQVLLVQPQSAAHGLTLTRANRVIWASPTDRTDLYEQINHRIRRKGQTRKQEVIHIAGEDTVEVDVFDHQMNKRARMFDLLNAIAGLSKVA